MTHNDLFVVLGTSAQALPISQMIGKRGDLDKLAGTSVLCNLEQQQELDETIFDYVFFQPITKAIGDIKNLIEKTIRK